LKKVLFELRKHDYVEIFIVASSSILLEKYGKPYQDLYADGFNVDKKIDCILLNDSHESMAKTVGLSVIEHASYFNQLKPDILLVVGDRFDIMGPVTSAAMMNIPMAHIQGGEISGTIDNLIRDIVTRFATLHFVSTEMSKEKLITWGIKGKNVFNFGCPAIEYIMDVDVGEHFDRKKIKKEFKREIHIKPFEKYFIVMVHPDTTNSKDVDMDIVLRAVDYFGLRAFVFYPNVDANNSKIISDISKHRRNESFFIIRHMPIEGFVHTMAHCCCMIGNSSAGIREAASFGVPVVNIGNRQNGRERNLNVMDVRCEYEELLKVIKYALSSKLESHNIYYQKDSSKKIAAEIIHYISNNNVQFHYQETTS